MRAGGPDGGSEDGPQVRPPQLPLHGAARRQVLQRLLQESAASGVALQLHASRLPETDVAAHDRSYFLPARYFASASICSGLRRLPNGGICDGSPIIASGSSM